MYQVIIYIIYTCIIYVRIYVCMYVCMYIYRERYNRQIYIDLGWTLKNVCLPSSDPWFVIRVGQSRFHCILVNVTLTVSAMPLSDINLVAGKRTFIPDSHYDR